MTQNKFSPGPDWQWGNQNGSEDSIGTVYRIKSRGEVYVRSLMFIIKKNNVPFLQNQK